MGKTQQAAGGGLTAADKAKLVPNNIRQGVTLFEGTAKEVTGSLIPASCACTFYYFSYSDNLFTAFLDAAHFIENKTATGKMSNGRYSVSTRIVRDLDIVFTNTNTRFSVSVAGVGYASGAVIHAHKDDTITVSVSGNSYGHIIFNIAGGN